VHRAGVRAQQRIATRDGRCGGNVNTFLLLFFSSIFSSVLFTYISLGVRLHRSVRGVVLVAAPKNTACPVRRGYCTCDQSIELKDTHFLWAVGWGLAAPLPHNSVGTTTSTKAPGRGAVQQNAEYNTPASPPTNGPCLCSAPSAASQAKARPIPTRTPNSFPFLVSNHAFAREPLGFSCPPLLPRTENKTIGHSPLPWCCCCCSANPIFYLHTPTPLDLYRHGQSTKTQASKAAAARLSYDTGAMVKPAQCRTKQIKGRSRLPPLPD
jgi:hypothetical protein